MHDLSAFHRCAIELLRHIGFDPPSPAADQDVISLTVEQRCMVHMGSLDATHWFMQAEIDGLVTENQGALLVQALRANQMTPSLRQPVVALDADNRLCCWLCLPLSGCDLPAQLSAFDALIACAEGLLTAPRDHLP
ncbi:CesT family type III secretion system chaperone, partial [Paludibacterium sp.]|uniref:CesT family type III secretion system chaperone n=1 Tax=Paludibacterium sp. TaxID=1917523 RepID=UPI0025F109E6